MATPTKIIMHTHGIGTIQGHVWCKSLHKFGDLASSALAQCWCYEFSNYRSLNTVLIELLV